jgi:hypothetical protein
MVDGDEERYICRWCTEWETVEAPTLQDCLIVEDMVQEDMSVPSVGQGSTQW